MLISISVPCESLTMAFADALMALARLATPVGADCTVNSLTLSGGTDFALNPAAVNLSGSDSGNAKRVCAPSTRNGRRENCWNSLGVRFPAAGRHNVDETEDTHRRAFNLDDVDFPALYAETH